MIRLIAALIFITSAAPAQDLVVRIDAADEVQLRSILELTDDVWTHSPRLGAPVDIRLTRDAYAVLLARGVQHQVIIKDVHALAVAERAHMDDLRTQPAGGFFDVFRDRDEIIAYFQNLAATHPELMEFEVIGQSLEGRDIWAAKLTAPGDASKRTQFAITGCQHAREWVSPMAVTYYVDALISGYGVDPQITAILDEIEFHVIPIINPDGYVFSWADPDNRFWRKNRRENIDGCFGVDLNRNWPFEWGHNNGSSANECSSTYRGESPASEPETVVASAYLETLDRISVHLDIHTSGRLILSPWGFTDVPPPAYTLFDQLNIELHDAILDVHGHNFDAGPTYSTIYPVSGGICDWTYAELGALAWTLELCTSHNPPPENIITYAEETYAAVMLLAEEARRPGRFVPTFNLPGAQATGEPFTVVGDVHPLPNGPEIESATLYSRAGDDEFAPTPLSREGRFRHTGEFTAGACGDIVEFYVELLGANGAVSFYPPDGVLAFPVYDLMTIHEDDAEMDNGWQVDPDDDPFPGQWERADPEGTLAQPENDHTPDGTDCFVTGALAGDDAGDFDVDDTTHLFSPVFDAAPYQLGDGEAYVSYWRWYQSLFDPDPDDDFLDVKISNDGGRSWKSLEYVQDGGAEWVFRRFRIRDLLEPTDQMVLRFAAADNGDDSLVEAAIDDIRVEAVYTCPCPDGADFNNDGDLSILDFVAFQAAWVGQDPCADINDDGAFNILDFVAYQALFQGG